jgi:hypothetical protein
MLIGFIEDLLWPASASGRVCAHSSADETSALELFESSRRRAPERKLVERLIRTRSVLRSALFGGGVAT